MMENIKKRRREIRGTKEYKEYWRQEENNWRESFFYAQKWQKKIIDAYLSERSASWRLFHQENKSIPWDVLGMDLYFEMNTFSKDILERLVKTFRNIDEISDDGVIINLRRKEYKEKAECLLRNEKIKLWNDIQQVIITNQTKCKNNKEDKKRRIVSIIKKRIELFHHRYHKNIDIKYALISARQQYVYVKNIG